MTKDELLRVMKESLDESVKDGSLVERIKDHFQQHDAKVGEIVAKYFPEHVGHEMLRKIGSILMLCLYLSI